LDCKPEFARVRAAARQTLLLSSSLHFNAAGYKLLAERVRPFLPKN